MKGKHPKRRKDKYNPYSIWEMDKHYYISFTDGQGNFHEMEISRVLYEVPHVLRYYSMGRIPNGTGNQAIVQVALVQEGNGGDIYWSWYGFTSRVSWCACFVSWCGEHCGYLESGAMLKFSLCSDGVKWFQDKGQFKGGSYVPAAGDIIFFDWRNDESIDHVGIVESVAKGMVNTIEGNSGDAVRKRSYPVGDDRIYGYGMLGES